MATTGEPFGLFWDSDGGDRTYSADSFERWLKKFFTSGVFEGDLQVQASSGMTLVVGSGYTNADGKVKFWNANFNVTLDAANSTYPRIDTVVIRRDNVNRQITCEKVTGQYSGDIPQPTAPTRTAEIYEMVLAQINIPAGATEVTQANITDTRQNTELCGYITGTVTEMDFSQFVAQFESYFAQFKSQHEHDWSVWEQTQVAAYNAWFATVQAQQVADKADWDAWYAALQEELHNLPADTAEYLQIQIDEIRNNGTTGSIFHITTTNTELEGKTVTVSCGSEVRTATFDANLECTVIGFKSVGVVTITSTDGIQTATRTLNIDYYSKYEVPIAFWSATVNIQGDDNLKGATITVKDSNDTTVATVVLNVITGQGVFNAQKADTYTFNYTFSGTDYSENLVVDEETTYSLSLSAGFDWKGWVDTAQFLDSTDYNSLDEVLADEEAVRELCLEHACVDYLADIATANEDVETIINNDLFAKWVNNSDYALDFLGANVAIKALMDEADKYGYGEWCLMPQVPTMTANNAPYGTASASSILHSSTDAWYAFAHLTEPNAHIWATANNQVVNSWLAYTFISPQRIKKVYVKNRADDALTQGVKVCCIQYNNGTDWITVTDDFTVPQGGSITVDIDSDITASSWRLFIKSNYGEALASVRELQFYAYAPKGNVPVMTANNAPYGEASASSVNQSGYEAYKAFDNNPSPTTGNGWTASSSASFPQWIQYKFVNPICAKRMSLGFNIYNASATVKVSASNDGNTFTDIVSGVTVAGTEEKIVSMTDNDNYYLIYRLTLTAQTRNSGASIGQLVSLQFYGRELKNIVPIMTSNTTPSGEAFQYKGNFQSEDATRAYKVFDRDSTTTNLIVNTTESYFVDPSTSYVGYKFPHPTKIKGAFISSIGWARANVTNNVVIEASNDNDTWETISNEIAFAHMTANSKMFEITSDSAYTYFRARPTTHNTCYAVAIDELKFYGSDYSEKEFESGTTKKWLYDHGLELEPMNVTDYRINQASTTITPSEKNENSIKVSCIANRGFGGAGTDNKIDLTSYSYAFEKYERITLPNNMAVYITPEKTDANAVAVGDTNGDGDEAITAIDVSNVNGSYYIWQRVYGYQSSAMAQAVLMKELWLE